MIAFTCTSCRKKLSAKDDLAGKKVKCPGCGAVASVPRASAATLAGQAGRSSTKPEDDRTLPPKDHGEEANESLSDAEGHTAIGGRAKAESTVAETQPINPE